MRTVFGKQRARAAYALVSMAVAGCGGSTEPSTPTPPPVATSPAVAGATPPSTDHAASPPAGCTLGASSVVARGRARAEIVSDGHHVAVTHRIRHRTEEDFCTATYAVSTAALPLGAATTWDEKIPLSTCGELNLFAHVDRTSLGLTLTSCVLVSDPASEEPGTGDVTCRVGFIGSNRAGTEHVLDADGLLDGAKAGMAIGVSGNSYFAAAAIVATGEHDGVRGWFVDGSTRSIPIDLGRAPTGMDLANPEQYAIDIRAREDGGFIVEHGATTIARRVRSEVDAHGTRVGVPTPLAVTLPAPPAVVFATEHGEHGALSHVRLYRAGAPSPVAGIDEAVATFAPRFAEFHGRHALAWSEGTGTTTRIRFALVDTASGALVGAPVDVSTASIEAGYASVSVVEGRALVAWDEKHGSTWEVRAAELTCR